jgi:hypothetical protein
MIVPVHAERAFFIAVSTAIPVLYGIIFLRVFKIFVMKNPTFNRQHIREYLLYGLMAAVVYMLPVIYYLYNNRYENLYYLYIGCALFMGVIFYYNYKLLDRKYDKRRAVSMLISGHLATLAGIVISCLLAFIAVYIAFPELLSSDSNRQVLPNAHETNQVSRPSYLLLMILSTATIGNFAVGAFISVIVTYAGKRDQTKDKPANLEMHIPRQK